MQNYEADFVGRNRRKNSVCKTCFAELAHPTDLKIIPILI